MEDFTCAGVTRSQSVRTDALMNMQEEAKQAGDAA